MQTELFDCEEDRSEIWSITRLTQAIRKSLQSEFSVIWVRGEISNLRSQASGHRYFLLKDQNCQLKAVLFRRDANNSAKYTWLGHHSLKQGLDFSVGGGVYDTAATVNGIQVRGATFDTGVVRLYGVKTR